MAKVAYSPAVRKQLQWIAVLVGAVVVTGVVLFPINTLAKVVALTVVLVVFGYIAMRAIRTLAHTAPCPSCGVDLYDVILAAPFKREQFKYCPSCGAGIEA